MRAHNAPVGRVNERHEVLADPQVLHNGTLVEVDHGDLGRVRLPRTPARFNGAPAAPHGPAAHLGPHAADVLGELGHDAAQQQAWREARVLGTVGAAGPAPAFPKSSVPTTPR